MNDALLAGAVAWAGGLMIAFSALTSILRRSVHPLVVAAQACAPVVIPVGWAWFIIARLAGEPWAGVLSFVAATWWYRDLRGTRRDRRARRHDVAGSPGVRLLSANLLITNDESTRCAEAIAAIDAHVIVTVETSDSHRSALQQVLRNTHGDARVTGTGPRGSLAALWVRRDVPVRYHGRRRVGVDELPEVVVDVDGAPVRIIGVHLHAPVNRDGLRAWEGELETLRRIVADLSALGERVVLAGDFNAALAHRGLRRLLDVVVDAHQRRGRALLRTWPVQRGRALLMGIDHVLLADGVTCTHIDTRALPGSDHLALCADLTVTAPR